MSDSLILIDREALLAELRQAFDAQTAEVLMRVLDRVAAQVHQAGVTREDFSELKQIVRELAEAQHRTEEQVSRLELAVEQLAEAQRRSEERLSGVEERVSRLESAVEQLAEAQRRSEERLSGVEERVSRLESAVERLELAVEQLAEAQRKTEERLNIFQTETREAIDRLTWAIDRLQKQVGGLSDTVGGDIEDIAYIVLYNVLKRELGWQVSELHRSWQRWDTEPEEVNIFGTATDPARPEATIWIVGEAKHNLTLKEVKDFIKQVERARQHLAGEIFPVCFCYRVRPEVEQILRDTGIRLVFSYGKLV